MQSLQVISAKLLSQSMGVNISTAERYLRDIKKEYCIKTVLLSHVNQYFKINAIKE